MLLCLFYGYIGSCFRVKCVNIPVSNYGQVVSKGSANLTDIRTATGAQVELEKGGRSWSSRTIIIKWVQKRGVGGVYVYSVYVCM